MLKKHLFTFICCLPLALQAFSIKDKLKSAHEGDFIVTHQNNIYSILLVRNISDHSIRLEEISVPQNEMNLLETSWRTWLEAKSPGHSSWTTYEIDFAQEALTDSYSFSQKQWLYLDDSDYLFAKLMSLPLKKVPVQERRRIGPAPQQGEPDRRQLWNPPMVLDGKKIKNATYEVYKGKWPKDDSTLSECSIILYFDTTNPTFPFPYWLEVTNGHYTFKLKTLDSGTDLKSPLANVSIQPLFRFVRPIEQTKRSFILAIQFSAKEKEFHVFAEDKADNTQERIPLPFSLKAGPKNGTYLLEIPKKKLNNLLRIDHKYRLLVMPKKQQHSILIAEDAFVWKP
jgi:hypothetical protein